MDVTQAAGSVRKDATDGIGAPQVGLDPRYPSSAEHRDDVEARHLGAAGAYEPSVDDYLQAAQAIKRIAPLTRRPAWDVSGKQINGAIQQAADAIRLTQLIDVYGQAHSFNATLTFTETPCPP